MLKISVFLTLNGFFAKIAKNTKKNSYLCAR